MKPATSTRRRLRSPEVDSGQAHGRPARRPPRPSPFPERRVRRRPARGRRGTSRRPPRSRAAAHGRGEPPRCGSGAASPKPSAHRGSRRGDGGLPSLESPSRVARAVNDEPLSVPSVSVPGPMPCSATAVWITAIASLARQRRLRSQPTISRGEARPRSGPTGRSRRSGPTRPGGRCWRSCQTRCARGGSTARPRRRPPTWLTAAAMSGTTYDTWVIGRPRTRGPVEWKSRSATGILYAVSGPLAWLSDPSSRRRGGRPRRGSATLARPSGISAR